MGGSAADAGIQWKACDLGYVQHPIRTLNERRKFTRTEGKALISAPLGHYLWLIVGFWLTIAEGVQGLFWVNIVLFWMSRADVRRDKDTALAKAPAQKKTNRIVTSSKAPNPSPVGDTKEIVTRDEMVALFGNALRVR